MLFTPPVALVLLGLTFTAWGCSARASQEASSQAVPPQEARPSDAVALDGEPLTAAPFGADPFRQAWSSTIPSGRPQAWSLAARTLAFSGRTMTLGTSRACMPSTISGRHLGVFTLDGAEARDWEDLVIGPRFEPGVDADRAPVETTLTGVSTVTVG